MFEALIQEGQLRNYSPKTIKAYLNYNQQFLLFCRKQPAEVTYQDIRAYLLCLQSKLASSSQINLAHNALNFYYKTIKKRNFKPIPFQKREDSVKEILSPEEIKRLIDVTINPKHRLIISLLYATGVRVSELVNIRLEHLDFDRKMLLVKQGKGKKDRYTILSGTVISELKNYLDGKLVSVNKNSNHSKLQDISKRNRPPPVVAVKQPTNGVTWLDRVENSVHFNVGSDYNSAASSGVLYPSPTNKNHYLFPSRTGHLCLRSIQAILNQAARKARIIKTVTPHRLRHSFATHLRDNKVEYSVIQKLLGHRDIRTTQQYARVTNCDLKNIANPHDALCTDDKRN